MKIEGLVVKHKTLGVGTVTKFDGTFLTIAFESKTSMFQYPAAFTGFIEAADPDDQAAILKSIEDDKATAIAKQQEIEATKRAEAERIAAEEERIQNEKDALMNLSEKELLVEAVMALRGLYSRIKDLEESYEDLDDTVSNLKKELKSVKTEAIRKDLEMTSMKLQKH